MYTIFVNTYIPYEYNTLDECIKYIWDCSLNLRNSVRLVEKDTRHLTIRCPVSAVYLEIVSTEENLKLLHQELKRQNLYRL